MSQKIKNKHKENPDLYSGFTNWHKTEKFKNWVISSDRINKISESTKKRWQNVEYKNKTINKIKTVLTDGRCKKTIEYKEKMSKKISELYSNGLITNNSNKYKTGKYNSKKMNCFFMHHHMN